VALYGFVSHPHHLGAVWYLVLVLVIVLVWLATEVFRWRTKYQRPMERHLTALHPPQQPPTQPDPVEAELKELYTTGSSVMSTFTTSEFNLWSDEVNGRPPPQGRTYAEWHELGARDLRKWLSEVDSAVEALMSAKAADELRHQRDNAPIKPVRLSVSGDYEDLWLDCAHRLDWLRKEYNSRSTGDIYAG
jgi:hypothetical protein